VIKQRHLKAIRVSVSLLVFFLAALLFLDLTAALPLAVRELVLYPQFVPSLLQFLNATSLAATGFIVVLLLSALFGRVFCSTLCPLGTLQDIIIRLSERFRKPRKVRFRYKKPHTALRYGLLIITVFSFLCGSLLAVNLLDPFANFGRLFSDLVRPAYIGIRNLTVHTLELFDNYSISPAEWKVPSPLTLILPLLFLGVLIGLSVRKGRLYCNTLCPVGTLLGLVARFALFKIKIDEASCSVCARCSIDCKANCIRLKNKEIDFSRCVACYDCISVCPAAGIGYRLPQSLKIAKPFPVNASKRAFLAKSFVYLVGFTGLTQLSGRQARSQGYSSAVGPPRPVSPPGSQSLSHFSQSCIACHLCVSACPTQVLQPAFLEYRLSGILQPRMDYHISFCNFDCTLCGEVCPTGAILPLDRETKHITQLGIAKFLSEQCIVYTEHTACGACAEHCPTKAVQMVPYQENLTIPAVREGLCVGCGACEYACPVRPERAIVVAGHARHLAAQKPELKPVTVDVKKDFPF
jgi:polyferredoxin